MKRRSCSLALLVAVGTLAQGACSDEGFGKVRAGRRLTVELENQEEVAGSPLARLPLKVEEPQPFTIVVRALDASGNVDAGFNGWVRVSAKPGAIERIEGEDADGRNVLLTNGESPSTEVKVTNAYGTTFILADDLGYAPVDPLREPRPACSNGLDDDGDGKIDFPADEGCAFANDDSEEGGSYAQGSSPPIFYHLPRIADVRGLRCDGAGSCFGTGKTPYAKQQVFLDTGYHDKEDGTRSFDFDMVVTRISSDGFYATDTKDPRNAGYGSIFVFNFSAPPRMRVCDRLKTFAGTASEFYGFTQISYPTWTLEEWDPQKRPCLVPEPAVLGPLDVPNPTTKANGSVAMTTPPSLPPRTGDLVRALTGGADGYTVMVTPKFGRDKVQERNGVFIPEAEVLGADGTVKTPARSNCDLNDDDSIDYTPGSPEQRCADACNVDPECTEYSNFAARSTFRLTISDGSNRGAVQADATASTEFKPLEMKGQPIKAFAGTLHFFSGGSQYTIEARCKDDIVVDLKAQPLPSDKACVFPRTVLDENPQ